MLVVLCLDHGQRKIGAVVQHEVGTTRHPSAVQLAANDDTPLGKSELFAHLEIQIPARSDDRRNDEFRADIALG